MEIFNILNLKLKEKDKLNILLNIFEDYLILCANKTYEIFKL